MALALALSRPHRFAQYNHVLRTGSFVFTFFAFAILWIERGRFSVWETLAAVLTFVVYPHLAFLHTRLVADPKRAEQFNFFIDAALLGAWATQIHFALWPSVGLLIAVCLNSAGYGHVRRLLKTLALFAACAVAWGLLAGFVFEPATGPLVTTVCIAGILLYVSAIGLLVHIQNKHLVHERHALQSSEQQFRFIADNVSDLVAMLDVRGGFLYASAPYQKRFGVEAVRAGTQWLALVQPEDQQQAGALLQEVVTTGQPKSMVLRMVSARGVLYLIDCKANPVLDETGATKTVVLICNDISRLLDS